MPKKKQSKDELIPSTKLQERAKDFLNERIKASRKVVDSKKGKWATWKKMYNNEQVSQKARGDSNLVIPKADYIVEVISSKIINTIFSVADWLTLKHPNMDMNELRKRQAWLIYVMERQVKYYVTALELFKAAPIKGTGICKVYPRNYWPYVEYMELEDFLPDYECKKPGDVQEMRYCAQLLRRDLNKLKAFVRPITKTPVYFNIDLLEKEAEAKKAEAKKAGDTTVKDDTVPIYDLVEYHGEFEVSKNKWRECLITASIEHKEDDKVQHIIRLEPSQYKYYDKYQMRDVYLKPFVASIYGVNPGEFYGKSAISSVESLITEQTDHHNLYMENHKRLMHGITKVLNRSKLTREHLKQQAGSIWYMNSFDDVEVETTPEVNLQAFNLIHNMYDREIEKTSSVTNHNLGVGNTKRETLGEVREMIGQSNDRFQLYIQMSGRLTLRPTSSLVYLLMRNSLNIFDDQELPFADQTIQINKGDFSDDMEVTFAVTTLESEYSKYTKQDTFPKLLETFAMIAGDRLNTDEIVKEMGILFNYIKPERFLHPDEPRIPIAALPEEIQLIAQASFMELERTKQAQGGK